MTTTYSKFSTKATPQRAPIPGEQQVKNSAGGFVYQLDQWKAFERFLILGSEGGTYYTKEQEHTAQAATNTLACIAEDGKRAVDLIVAISDSGRAPKNTPAEFALALAAAAKDVDTRAYALAALPKVCRIGTHLFHFVDFVRKQRGVSRMLRRALADWYRRYETADNLAYELAKYQSRDGWGHKDVLRQAHVDLGPDGSAAARWACGIDAEETRSVLRKNAPSKAWSYGPLGTLPAVLAAVDEAKTASTARVVEPIRAHNLSREMLPTEQLTKADVWEALLDKMPPHAMLRNLGNMSKVGLLVPLSDAARTVLAKIEKADERYLREKRLHPVAVLLAMRVYGQGWGVLGKGSWETVPAVVDALDAMFYRAFGAIEPTGRRFLFGVDVSGSMSSSCGTLPISCAEGAAAMALACAKAEREYHIMGFAHDFRDLGITPLMRLDDALRKTQGMNFGATDCALPMKWATERQAKVDVFVVITDNETWVGNGHPSQALREYRQKMGIQAKQVVIGMTATNLTIADPKDPLTLDVAGFDASVPQALGEFARV